VPGITTVRAAIGEKVMNVKAAPVRAWSALARVDRRWLPHALPAGRGIGMWAGLLLLAVAPITLLGGNPVDAASATFQADGARRSALHARPERLGSLVPDPNPATSPAGDTLTLAPDFGQVGATVTASGTGYGSCIDPDTSAGTVALLWDQAAAPIAIATVQDGGFTTSFEVPAEPGSHRVRSSCMFIGTLSGKTMAAAAFRVLAPTLVLDPVEGAAGSEFVASGDEYPPACADVFALQFDRTPLPPRALERTRDPGEEWVRFQATVDVPATASPRPHEVSVRCSADGRAPALAMARFQVTEPPTTEPPTTEPPTTTTTTTAPKLQPSIASVTPGSTPPGRVVEVGGNTGSCNRAGTLSVHGISDAPTAVAADQHGDFVTRFTVPTGTFPRAYKLWLIVDCNGQPQRAGATLTVTNHAPVAVDDLVSTPQDTAVAIAVTGNDRDPDGDGDYPTLVFEQSQPAHGTTEVRPDSTIVYTPDPGFVGQDRLRYSNCDVLAPRNAAGKWRLACDTATVTVTVNPGISTTTTSVPPTSVPPTSVPPTSVPPTSVPPTSVPPTSTRPDCQPRPGDIRGFGVDPAKGQSGAQLHVTAKADRRLAACPLGILLGGSRLGPDLVVQPDGAISRGLPVPNGVKPGASTFGLATPGGQVLAQVPFEVLPTAVKKVPPWWQRDPVRLLVAGAAFALGVLARAATRRWRRVRDDRQREAVPQYLRAEPHATPVQTALNQTTKGAPSFTVGLRPHRDAGTQTLMEVTG
jgi:hypothetical protein